MKVLFTSSVRNFWPVRDSMKTFTNLSISNGLGGTLYTDLYVDKLGGLRMALASALTNSDNDTVKTLQNFAQGGGNLALKGHYPLLFFQSKTYPNFLSSTVFLAPRIGFSIPALNKALKNPDFISDMGIEWHNYVSTENKKIALIMKLRFAGSYLSDQLAKQYTYNGRKTIF